LGIPYFFIITFTARQVVHMRDICSTSCFVSHTHSTVGNIINITALIQMRHWATRSAIFGSKLFEYITILRGKAVNRLIIYYLEKLVIWLKVYFWKKYFVYLMWNKLLEKLLFIILATTPMHIPLTLHAG